MSTEEEIAEALAPTVRAFGLEIWDVERSGATVRVFVERPGGVDLDTLSELAGAVSAILDGRDDLVPPGRYLLEVSSPGLERRLRHPRHFASSVGEEVAVKTVEPVLGTRRLAGKLAGATDADITLAVGTGVGESGQLVTVPLPLVERAHVVFRWPAPAGATTDNKGRKRPRPRPAGARAPGAAAVATVGPGREAPAWQA